MEDAVPNLNPQVPQISAKTRWNLRIFALATIGIALWFGVISMGMVVKAIAKSAEDGEALNLDGKDGNGALGTILTGVGYFLFSVTMAIAGLGIYFQKLWSRSLGRLICILVGLVSVFALFIGIAVAMAGYDPDGNGEGIRLLIGASGLMAYTVWGWLSLRGFGFFTQVHRV